MQLVRRQNHVCLCTLDAVEALDTVHDHFECVSVCSRHLEHVVVLASDVVTLKDLRFCFNKVQERLCLRCRLETDADKYRKVLAQKFWIQDNCVLADDV